MNNIFKFFASLAICFGTIIANSLLAHLPANTWYSQLIKPVLVPPDWLIAPVWIFLHFLMAIALYIVWTSNDENYKFFAFSAFAYQLFLSVAWSALFFEFHFLQASYYVIILLIALTLATITFFGFVRAKATYLLIPYFCWMCFTAYLNYNIWQLNK